MLQRIKDSYFSDHTYSLIYFHLFCHRIASSAMYIFTGPYFLTLGMPLHFVMLFYGLEFGLRGTLCPIGMTFFNKVGLVRAMAVSFVLFLCFFIGVSFAEHSLFIAFFSLGFAAMSGAIYYPLIDIFEACYVKQDHNRGKQYTMGIILKSLGGVVGAASYGFLLTHYGYASIIGLILLSLIMALIPFFKLHAATPYQKEIRPKEIYSFLSTDEFKPYWKPFFGLQLMIIVNSVMIPLFIFSLIGRLDVLGYLIAVALIVETIVTLAIGHHLDKSCKGQTFKTSSYAYKAMLISYIFFAKTPFAILLTEALNKITYNALIGSFFTSIHMDIREKFPQRLMVFGAAWQMALCFGELIVIPIYALIAYWIGMKVFYITCIGAVIGLYMIISFFKDNQNETEKK